MEDRCEGCVRLQHNMNYRIEICPKCNELTYECYLEGWTYVEECKKCGHGIVSFSYVGNCERKREICEYILDFSGTNEEGIVKFCKRYNMKMVTLKKLIRMKKVIKLKGEISNVLGEEEFMKNIGVAYVMDPPMSYSNFYICKESIRSRWLNPITEVSVEE